MLGNSERYFTPEGWRRMHGALTDIGERRQAQMDEHGIETMILSLNSPAIQAFHHRQHAVQVARMANDFLVEQVARNPIKASITETSSAPA